MDIMLIIFIIITAIISYLIYKYIYAKDTLKNVKEGSPIKNNFQNNQKVLQYFGGDYCPFSNTSSNAYKVIKDFEDEYSNKVTIKYYWVGKDDDYMRELKIDYVPAILNGNNDKIDLSLPEDTDSSKLSNDELKEILLENIYNKL